MPAENSSSSSFPYFLQTADGKISLPILFGLIMSAMIGAVILTLTIYALVIRRFNQHFEVKERVTGHHMSFLEATVAEREDADSSSSSSEMSSSTRSSSSSSPFEDRMQPSEFVEEDFEDVSNIMSPPQKKKHVLANSNDKFSYASSAREVSV